MSPAPARCACASPGPAAFYCVYYYYYIINTVTAAAARLPRARVCRCARRSYGTPRQPDRQTDGRTARVGPVSGPQPLTSPVAPPTVFDATTTAALPAATLHTAAPHTQKILSRTPNPAPRRTRTTGPVSIIFPTGDASTSVVFFFSLAPFFSKRFSVVTYRVGRAFNSDNNYRSSNQRTHFKPESISVNGRSTGG